MANLIFRAAVLSAVAAIFMATAAEADHRPKYRGYRDYYAGRDYVDPPRYLRYFFVPREVYRDDDEFDEEYYDPTDDMPVQRQRPAVKKKAVVKAPSAKVPAKKLASVDKPALHSAGQPTQKKPVAAKPATGAISCEKAAGIVSGFGFSDVKAVDCGGQIHAFNAARDGKPFAIKVNAKTGELTEVRKVQ